MTVTSEQAGPTQAALQCADGVELIGEMKGSGYKIPPSLVRRADGQTIQLTPLLYATLREIDGVRDDRADAELHARLNQAPIEPREREVLAEGAGINWVTLLLQSQDPLERVDAERAIRTAVEFQVALSVPFEAHHCDSGLDNGELRDAARGPLNREDPSSGARNEPG